MVMYGGSFAKFFECKCCIFFLKETECSNFCKKSGIFILNDETDLLGKHFVPLNV